MQRKDVAKNEWEHDGGVAGSGGMNGVSKSECGLGWEVIRRRDGRKQCGRIECFPVLDGMSELTKRPETSSFSIGGVRVSLDMHCLCCLSV